MDNKREVDSAIFISRSDRMVTGVLAAILLAVAIGAAAYGFLAVVEGVKEIIVAVIAGAASLLSAIFVYAFQRAKDREMAAMQRHREIELATRKVKQENYSRILGGIAAYVREPEEHGDQLTTSYLQAWVAGSADVLRDTQRFLDRRDHQTLDSLLRSMRVDLNDFESNSISDLSELTSMTLFRVPAPKPPPQGLRG